MRSAAAAPLRAFVMVIMCWFVSILWLSYLGFDVQCSLVLSTYLMVGPLCDSVPLIMMRLGGGVSVLVVQLCISGTLSVLSRADTGGQMLRLEFEIWRLSLCVSVVTLFTNAL